MNATLAKTPWARLSVMGVALAAIVGVILLAFLWPAVTAEPKSIPLAMAGPDAQVTQFESGIAAQSPDLFAFSTVSDRDAAVQLIQTRQVYGAIVLAPSPEILVSSAANAAIAGMLGKFSPELAANLTKAMAAQGHAPSTPITVPVTDVVPLVSADPNGVILSASTFPLVLGGLIGGVVISLVVVGLWRRLTAILVLAVVGGFTIAGILQGWFGGLQGNYLVNVGVIALALLAIGGTTIGFAALLGRGGLGLAAVVFVLFANPISGATLPPEFIVRPWGAIGQWFPPGAAGNLLRNESYFPSADSLLPWLILFGWAVLAVLLISVASRTHQSAAGEPTPSASHGGPATAL
ncbi:MAG TPA: hypothetical protein PJ998_08775 [Terrimesophilobacter sp.]|nr:hypothetical protein [Terrimesophilobacter sp.]